MAKEPLDSERVNYLIWRYLLESGYRETAVHLQKEWAQQDPQQLEFAPHVKNYALVSALNKGLLYNALERESAPTPRDVGSAPASASSGIFGPLTLRPTATATAAAASTQIQSQALNDETLEKARKRLHVTADDQSTTNNGPAKHQIEDGPSPAKRPRLSNGYENGFDTAPKSPMDVDEEAQNGDGNAYPSPEMLPSPIVATNGPEKGTQMGRVEDLTPQTTFLDLQDDTSSAFKNTVLLQCEWNPQDPALLAASGTDALARLWTISSRTTTADMGLQMDRDRVSPPYSSLLEEGASSKTTATIIAWAPDGSCIAVASEPGDADAARVEVWTKEDTSIAKFEAFYPPVILLRWNNASTLLLALSPTPLDAQQLEGAQGTLVRIMAMSGEDFEYRLPHHDLNDQVLDATWTSNDEFVLCGGDFLQAFTCIDGVITPSRKYEVQENYALSKVTFDWHSRLLATASDTGKIHTWNQQGESHSFIAHQGGITALIWQPVPTPTSFNEGSERLLASAGEDGAISIWNARSVETKYKCSMTMGAGVVGLSFTPDGAYIAGATSERILIWKVDDGNVPRASWNRGSELGWQTPYSHDSLEPEDTHSLCWAADGHTLAYSVNSMLALIKVGS